MGGGRTGTPRSGCEGAGAGQGERREGRERTYRRDAHIPETSMLREKRGLELAEGWPRAGHWSLYCGGMEWGESRALTRADCTM